MGRLLLLGIFGVVVWLRLSDDARAQLGEMLRDLSDSVAIFLLRASSGFAEDVSDEVQAQERARRTRWK